MAKMVNLDEILTFYCYYQALIYSHPSANSIEQRWKIVKDDFIDYEIESLEDEKKILLNSHLMLLISVETAMEYFQVADVSNLLEDS